MILLKRFDPPRRRAYGPVYHAQRLLSADPSIATRKVNLAKYE